MAWKLGVLSEGHDSEGRRRIQNNNRDHYRYFQNTYNSGGSTNMGSCHSNSLSREGNSWTRRLNWSYGANFRNYREAPQNRPNISDDDTSPNYFDLTAKVQFRSTLAITKQKTSYFCLIDFDRSQNIFPISSFFNTYDTIIIDVVQSKFGTSVAIGRGTTTSPSEKEISVKVHHAPNFSMNIMSVSKLSSQ